MYKRLYWLTKRHQAHQETQGRNPARFPESGIRGDDVTRLFCVKLRANGDFKDGYHSRTFVYRPNSVLRIASRPCENS